MKTEPINLTENIFAVVVPKESYQFEKENVTDENWHQLIYHIDNDDEESGFYGECEANQVDIGFDFEILGEVTADEISFDVTPYLKDSGKYYDGQLYYCFGEESDKVARDWEAFESLLQSKEIYFVNPMGDKSKWVAPDGVKWEDYEKQWQEAERKVVEKVVIIKKV